MTDFRNIISSYRDCIGLNIDIVGLMEKSRALDEILAIPLENFIAEKARVILNFTMLLGTGITVLLLKTSNQRGVINVCHKSRSVQPNAHYVKN